jgi:adenylate cyclase class 2
MAGHDRETEAKFHLSRPAEMEQRLRELGPNLIQSRVHETNLRFDTPAGDLSRQGRVLRLRLDNAAHLTFKSDTQLRDGALDRTEIEINVGDFEAARRLVEALGYELVFLYEKLRTVYELEGCQVMLDELPYGNFLEIEGEFGRLRPLAGRLGLNWDAAIPESYHGLFMRLHASRKLSFRDLSFENFKGFLVLPEDLGVISGD